MTSQTEPSIAEYPCPVCEGPVELGNNVCAACVAVWPTHAEAELLYDAMEAVAMRDGVSVQVSKRATLVAMVQLGVATEHRADVIFRALDFLVPLDCQGPLILP